MRTEEYPLPKSCPSCHKPLAVQRLYCQNCGTGVEGMYELPVLARLEDEDRAFMLEFVKFSGSLKKIAKHLKKSYPYVRNYLDSLIERIQSIEKSIKHNDHEN